MLKQALKGVRTVAQSTTTVFGNVASEIAGSFLSNVLSFLSEIFMS